MKKKQYAVPEGCKITSVDLENGVIIYECNEPEEPKFKRGDFVRFSGDGCKMLFIAKKDFTFIKDKNGVAEYHAIYGILNMLDFDSTVGSWDIIECGIMTPEEKQLLLDKMHEQGKDWDGEKIVDLVWKPKVGEPYWLVSTNDVSKTIWSNHPIDNQRFKDSRVFATKALANEAFTALQNGLKQAKKY